MARVLRDRQAIADLDAIYDYIAVENHNPQAADRFLDRLDAKLKLYAQQPELGERRPDLGEGIRVFRLGNYVAIYRPVEDGIDLLRVFEGHRDYPAMFRPPS